MGPTRKSLQQYCSVPAEAVLDMTLAKSAAIARQLLTEADAYNEMRNKEMSYCFYKRFCTLVVEVFPRHKEYREASNRTQMHWCMEMSQRAIDSLTLIAKELDEDDLKKEEEARKRSSTTESKEERLDETVVVRGSSTLPHTSQTSMTEELANRAAEPAAQRPTSANLPPKSQKSLTLTEAMKILNVSKEAKEIENTTVVSSVPHPQTKTTVISSPPASGTTMTSNAVELRTNRGGMGGMRPIFLPCSTVNAFTDVAQPNTELGAEGVETCAILAGRIATSNKCVGLQMTHLIFPEQVGASNTCEALGEEALFDYMLNYKLITIGWIHTHPRQNCFLSSVDLHTQCGYQIMLPEAIAIVVAPQDVKGNHVGIFRLHSPHGIKLIQVRA